MNQILIEKPKLPEEPFKGPRFLIGVRVENAPKSALFNPGKLNVRVGAQVMVETDQGIQIGVVASNKIPNIIQNDVAKLFPESVLKRKNKMYLNLSKQIVNSCQLNDIEIQVSKNCTVCDNNFWSFRENKTAQRQYSFIWI